MSHFKSQTFNMINMILILTREDTMKKILIPIALMTMAASAYSEEALKSYQISGKGFIRHETKKDADYQELANDGIKFTQTRINVSVKGDLADNYGYIFLAPQFSKISGQDEFVPSSTTANTQTSNSGALVDSRMDLHEGYFAIKPTQDDNFFVFAGRQELSYGDDLMLGAVPWHRIGRSFDGVRARYQINEHIKADAFSTKLQENNSAGGGIGDSNFHGIYVTGNFGANFNAVDLYLLNKDNHVGDTNNDINAYGTRLKSKVGDTGIDYRTEITLEEGRIVNNERRKSEYQMVFEAGYTVPSLYTTRVSAEYFDSTKHFDQFYPTAHKFLGYADQFSRRNIKGYVGHLSVKPFEKVTFLADYHVFQRHSEKDAVYNFGGTALGTTGTSKKVANEWDFVVQYNFTKTLQLSYGYSMVKPQTYLKDQNVSNTSTTHWSFLQLLASF